jgi:hypothetical protein
MNHCAERHQTISFAGVNAHFQNALAEKRIRDLQDSARTMLVHAKHRWPQAISAHLWPYALRMANDVHMHAPLQSGKSPIDLFSKIASTTAPKHFHAFGCPVYVLTERMQQGGKGSKWEERARIGLHLGTSPIHSRNISLVLNLRTGLVSPQFHVKFDDLFETVSPSSKLEILWQQRTGFVKSKGPPPTEPPIPDAYYLPPIADTLPSPTTTAEQQGMPPSEGALPAPDSTIRQNIVAQAPQPRGTSSNIQQEQGSTALEQRNESLPVSDSTVAPRPVRASPAPARENIQSAPTSTARTRTRTIRPPQRYIESVAFIAQGWDDIWAIQDFEIQEAMEDPIAFAASSSPDTMYLHEALKAPDREQFIKAMVEEVQAHEGKEHWELVPKSDVPDNTLILPAVWSMKRKRRINTREVYKWKARLNVHGGKQIKNVHYWETYSPVVKWSSIRLFLTLAAIKGWRTRQVDFVLAYPQADIETTLYMEIPRGFEFDGSRKTHCLRLKKNLYGQKQAGRVWNKHLHKGLHQNEFQTKFYRRMCLLPRQHNLSLLCRRHHLNRPKRREHRQSNLRIRNPRIRRIRRRTN